MSRVATSDARSVSMNEEDGDPPTFVRPLAYSTGLCLGVWIVHILADRIGAHAREGNGMSTAGINVPELPPPAVETEEEYAERIRNAIQQAMRRLARWLGEGRMSTVEPELRHALADLTEPIPKAEIRRVLTLLPDNCTLDDLVECLDERMQLRAAFASALGEVSQEEIGGWEREEAVENAEARAEFLGAEPGDEDMVSASYLVSLTRDEILEALDDLPDQSTMGDILQTLYVREHIKQGMWSLDNEPTFTHEEVKQSLSRWLTS
jgi:hypothetical protein